MESPFVQGRAYRRRDLHSRWGGQQRGGISTPSRHNVILLFTGASGRRHGYHDRWTDDGLFFFAGEGQRGNMQFVGGNRAIRDHVMRGKDLHLFEQVRKGYVQYVGQMVCTGFHSTQTPDTTGRQRAAIEFELALLENLSAEQEPNGEQTEELDGDSLAELRSKALADSAATRTPAERKSVWRRRSRAIRLYVLKRAVGRCEGCGAEAPFRTRAGQPYLEPHHIRRLSDGGPDHPRWVVAVCPNCHRHAHYADDAADYNSRLSDIVGSLEKGTS
jgi:5-methylcytosine-specific restriction enzyme A